MASTLVKICRRSLYFKVFSTRSQACITENYIILRNITLPCSSSTRRLLSDFANEKSEQGISIKDETRSRPKNVEDVLRVKPKQFDLSFEEYVKLKGTMRTRQRFAGMPFAVIGLGTSSVVSAYMFPEMFDATPENVQLIMGLDPLVFCGICGVASAGLGYAIGTQLFKAFWNIMNKEKATMLLDREKDFLERIQTKRFASFSKFEDDYYGESIKNLSDYRQWLRTQQKKAAADEKFTKEKQERLGQENSTVS